LEDVLASKKKQQNLYSSTTNKLAQYEEKQRQHEKDLKKRGNDNRLAIIAGLGALAIAVGAQFAYSALNPEPKATTAANSSASPSATPEPAQTNSPLVPAASLAENRVWTGTMQVNKANPGIQLFGDKAPQATANFLSLAKKGFYKGLSCHRLTTSGLYVLQCGDPKGDGTGGPGYSFGPIENAPQAGAAGTAVYKKGVLAMANSGGAYTNGSQFFIVYADSPLMPDYTVFGEITSGLTGLEPITKAGVAAGSASKTDGKPAVETKLGNIALN
jgi:peptidyl-prolyl cis-trans isomerase B (cyclophilin B)